MADFELSLVEDGVRIQALSDKGLLLLQGHRTQVIEHISLNTVKNSLQRLGYTVALANDPLPWMPDGGDAPSEADLPNPPLNERGFGTL